MRNIQRSSISVEEFFLQLWNCGNPNLVLMVFNLDKLSNTWPFVGVAIQVIISCVLILICQKKCSGKKSKKYNLGATNRRYVIFILWWIKILAPF